MKKLLFPVLLLVANLLAAPSSAQTDADTTAPVLSLGENQTFQQAFDSLSAGLIKARIPYGVLYNRTMQWGAIGATDTVFTPYAFYQAWWDMEHSRVAATDEGTYEAMRHAADSLLMQNIVPVLAIDYNFAMLDSAAMKDGRLSKVNGIFTDNNLAQAPYITSRMTLIGLPLNTANTDNAITFSFRPDGFSLSNTGYAVQKVRIEDAMEGLNVSLLANEQYKIIFSKEGTHVITISATLSDNTILKRTQLINILGGVSKGASSTDCFPEHKLLESDIPFKGYDEQNATTSFGDYHIFYHYTAPNSGDCERVLRKPIIIMDGYDPQDVTSWDILYGTYLQFGSQNLGKDLRDLGYDVIVLNFPKLGESINVSSPTQGAVLNIPSYTRKGSVGNLVADPQSHNNRDGGTDFIERNAFVLVRLMQKVDSALVSVGSDQKCVVVGPSMGGQISRYALAYMEKQYAAGDASMNPNTRLWISFDSPHWGADIPMGTQRTLKWFGYNAGRQEAKTSYDQQLHCTAGRQLLIEQLDGEQNNGTPNSWRQQYMANLDNNGLSGSHGWPSMRAPGGTIRKIALMNGSGNGTKHGTEGQQYIDAKGKIAGITLFKIDARYLQAPGVSGQYWQGTNTTFTTAFNSLPLSLNLGWFFFAVQPSVPYSTTNINPRGCMDVVPGSTYPSTLKVKEKFAVALNDQGIKNQTWNILPEHSFIPTCSALGFISPDTRNGAAFNWNARVDDRNLVCNGEIPFDNYFLPTTNEQHITLTDKNVAWLTQEIIKNEKNTGCPKICTNAILDGSDVICVNNGTTTFHLDTPPPAGSTTVWTLTGSLQDMGHTSSAITVKATGTSSASVTAVISNLCEADVILSRNVGTFDASSAPAGSIGYYSACQSKITSPFYTNITYLWSEYGGPYYSNGTNEYYFDNNAGVSVNLKLQTPCGTSPAKYFYRAAVQNNCGQKPANNAAYIQGNGLVVFPNPARTAWTFNFAGKGKKPSTIKIVDAVGKQVFYISKSNATTQDISCEGLATGVYVATIKYADGETETVKIVKE